MFKWLLGEKVKITFNGQVFKGSTKNTILQSALKNGVPIRHNCGSGVCGQCRVHVKSGKLVGGGKANLACQLYPQNDVEINQ
jgi:3-phenylpropionate/trans-cinnamate dioxygenase ferredoxin reductase subunit